MESEKSHSSFIKYEYFQTSDINWYYKLSDWKNVQSFGLVRKSITKKVLLKNERTNAKAEKIEKLVTTVENKYYISSKQVNIKEFSIATRGHWSIENKLHWHLDFTFKEDKNTTMNKNALMNLQIINKFCLGILNKIKSFHDNASLRRIKKRMQMNFEKWLVRNICYLSLS